jgi:hypothetical protein
VEVVQVFGELARTNQIRRRSIKNE